MKTIKEISSLGVGDITATGIAAIFWFYLATVILPDEFGQIHIHYKVQINRFGVGTNYIFGDASFGTTPTNCLWDDSSCHSVFTTVSGSPNSGNSQKP